MKNILVVNVNWVGDVIFSSPVFAALRQAYPQANISCLAVPRVKAILECIEDIDEIIVFDEKGQNQSPLGKLRLIAEIYCKHFDVAFLLHRSLTRALLVFLAGIPRRVGRDTKGRGIFLTHKVPALDPLQHRSDSYLQVIESFGVKVTNRITSLTVCEQSKSEIETILNERGVVSGDDILVINPGGNWDLKRWPHQYFQHLIARLLLDFSTKIILNGAPKDIVLIKKIVEPFNDKVIVLAGETNLKQVVALMQRACLMISADSGPLHLANSVGIPVIGIFGPTRPELTGPRGVGSATILQHDVGCNRKACYYLECSDNICMQAVTVDEVVTQAKKYIKAISCV